MAYLLEKSEVILRSEPLFETFLSGSFWLFVLKFHSTDVFHCVGHLVDCFNPEGHTLQNR